MAKQCPMCRNIVKTSVPKCSCGFKFYGAGLLGGGDAFAKNCMRIGGGLFVIAGLAVVAMRFL
jgi:hypothetical protein